MVTERKNLMEYLSHLSLRGIQCNKPHRNQMRNKNFPLAVTRPKMMVCSPFQPLVSQKRQDLQKNAS